MQRNLESSIPLISQEDEHGVQGTTPLLYLCWKKIIDGLFGLGGIVVLLLFFPIIALSIGVDSPGPIFYRQERLGYQGEKFFIYKFRSMHANAEQEGQAIWATEQDVRV